MTPDGQHWTVDRKIPLALIVTIAIQTAGVFFWIGQVSIRIDSLEKQINEVSINSNRLTRIEVQIENTNKSVSSMEAIEKELYELLIKRK